MVQEDERVGGSRDARLDEKRIWLKATTETTPSLSNMRNYKVQVVQLLNFACGSHGYVSN